MWVVSRLGSNLGLAILWFEEQLVLQSRTPCSWRIHPAGSGAEEEAIRTTPFGDVEDESHDVPTGYVPEDRPLISD